MSDVCDSRPVVLACQGLNKIYRQGTGEGAEVPVLTGVDLQIVAGERVAVVGASGSGKSTLLHLLGGLDSASAGKIQLMGRDLSEISDTERGVMRNRHLGFVYQFHHLLPEFTALENVAMPLIIRRLPKAEAEQRATAVLADVGLSHRLDHTPSELSGGERQRAAIARALVTEPACVLADEPTGNLDEGNSANVMNLLTRLSHDEGYCVIIVTHDLNLADKADVILKISDGSLSEQK